MTRVVITGAGGMVFPLTLAADFLASAQLRGAELVLHDIDAARAERTANAVRGVADHHALPLKLVVTADRREALAGATHVLITFQVGGLDAYRSEVEISRRYGLDFVAGDTLGPGGILRFLRSTPAFDALARDVLDLCPDALVLNYTNPMAMNCAYLARLGLNVVGLCHSIPGTAKMLSGLLSVPFEELDYEAAGINHQAWFVTLRHAGEDLNPRLKRLLRETFLPEYGGFTAFQEGGPAYQGGQERVRAEMMETFGYFLSESSHHASELVPYFRKSRESVVAHLPRRWDYLKGSLQTAGQEARTTSDAVAELRGKLAVSDEFGMRIVAAHASGEPASVYGNVLNDGFIDNLPSDACVEVPCIVDGDGVKPKAIGRLPSACAGLNLTAVAVQTTVVEAAANHDPEALRAAFALDPLTASVVDLPDIRALAAESIGAQRRWLPQWVRG
ncbi:alpha-glucosidase/alpha-galactosidase [Deinococcus yavapaiensis]|uniref:Alpha-galactosidase n=1 Tax=Deinococcus yavapaiensis KR-236 TaxID=694435 RepID=A0A318S9E4_9DEIO|nr:alpha-glucosidase/alpha-galactosidase [Deinococcus yavapaiensis]PYE54607.1 alpha-galactosidase [Deinococcus yavapaiensis KR-236]